MTYLIDYATMQESEVGMDNLATALLHEIKQESRRRFIIIIILIVALVGSNLAWLIAWNLPDKEMTESYELQGEDSANVVFSSGEGDVRINGENQGN